MVNQHGPTDRQTANERLLGRLLSEMGLVSQGYFYLEDWDSEGINQLSFNTALGVQRYYQQCCGSKMD
jgi:hypothetical protein